MKCTHCNNRCIKKGKTKTAIQKYQCTRCKKYQREAYQRNGCRGNTERQLVRLVKESCGIRSISRILGISTTTVLTIIRRVAATIIKPVIFKYKLYEADELKTYVRRKKNEQWLMYAINRKTKQVADFRVGRRTKRNLKQITDTLLFSCAKRIYTDGLSIYKTLIPKQFHCVVPRHTNSIERKKLSIRTHLKRLSRKTICYSKSITMLNAVVRIYFWG